MHDASRIEELRRRVLKDPATIAFAQLAEEYRRSGSYEDAIETCRAGLAIHPGYVSARVTLARALIELHELDSAEVELGQVFQHAPENLAAVRGLADIYHRRGDLRRALEFYQRALVLARHDPDLEHAIEEISRTLAEAAPPQAEVHTLAQHGTPLGAFDVEQPPFVDPALLGLERFLEAIHTYRQRRVV
jgi:tetratricopeptide (TPR) repeat protein